MLKDTAVSKERSARNGMDSYVKHLEALLGAMLLALSAGSDYSPVHSELYDLLSDACMAYEINPDVLMEFAQKQIREEELSKYRRER